MRGLVSLGLVAALVCVGSLAPTALARPSLEVLEAPGVVVANPSENMTSDNFNPEYVFSTKIRVTNDQDARQINAEAIVYPGPPVSDCPRDRNAYPVAFVIKTREVDPQETVTLGGSASPQDARGDAYWPMAVSESYRNARTNQTQEIEEGEHTFCTTLRVTGDDPACDRPANRTCVIAAEPFRSYVREENAPPEITMFSIGNEAPDPGQQVLFRADATDADTEPRPDDLSYTWLFNGKERPGKVVRFTFGTAGDHKVELRVTDGFDTVQRSTVLTVGEGADLDDGSQDAPLGLFVAVLALLVAARTGRRRR